MAEFREIIDDHAAMVQRIASVYERDPARIEDLMQDIWFAVWRALPLLKNEATIKGYIARIAQNVCVTHVRRAIARPAQALTDTFPDPAAPVHEAMTQAARVDRLLEAVRGLPDSLKAVATLYLEEMPIRDIAFVLGISESNVSVRLHRAKSAIRLSLGDLI
ncbi:RNA polymerase sigma factor [uncultured Paludibaculum sp.]|uniref:RNA polymerase sigma factor n=1 Tax=uncultured Paludibaculum sp. TaxID=1765020 RepID=UPI002AAB6F6D|nr:RNA polymerase sigma factor [uncultured Paludibaculum sp.]